jgi:hypothetical protein
MASFTSSLVVPSANAAVFVRLLALRAVGFGVDSASAAESLLAEVRAGAFLAAEDSSPSAEAAFALAVFRVVVDRVVFFVTFSAISFTVSETAAATLFAADLALPVALSSVVSDLGFLARGAGADLLSPKLPGSASPSLPAASCFFLFAIERHFP